MTFMKSPFLSLCVLFAGAMGISQASDWRFQPPSAWAVSDQGMITLDTVRRDSASFSGTFSADRTVQLPSNAHQSLWRLAAWVRTENLRTPAEAPALKVNLFGTNGLRETLSTYRADRGWTYFETIFRPPLGEQQAKLVISTQAGTGKAEVRDVIVEKYSPEIRAFEPVPDQGGSTFPWQFADRRFRLRGKVKEREGGQPVWADIDFSRLMLAAGLRAMVHPGSLRVVGMGQDGSVVSCPVVLDQALGNLAHDYLRNGIVKWRSVAGIEDYEIYFNPADQAGARPAEDFPVGVGELLSYAADARNPLWAGWPGGSIEAIDADGDGDLDLVLGNNDGGWFLARNVGTQEAPLFLPRERFAARDDRPSRRSNEVIATDWDGDGQSDWVKVNKKVRGNYVEGATATLEVHTAAGKVLTLRQSDGDPLVIDDATWMHLAAGDIDGDGRPELLVGSPDNTLRILTAQENNRDIVSMRRLPFATFVERPEEAADFMFRPSVADWNGDGKLDILVTSWSGECRLFLNDGLGAFGAPMLLQQIGGTIAASDSVTPFVVDWDGDGTPDLLLGDVSGRISWVKNEGSKEKPRWVPGGLIRHKNGEPIYLVPGKDGKAVQGRPELFMGYTSAAAVDLDGDGDLDLILNDAMGWLSWLENIGSRTSPVMADEIRPVTHAGQPVLTPWRNAPGLADWDGDGFPELIVLNERGELSRLTLDRNRPGEVAEIAVLAATDGSPAVINAPQGVGGPNPRALGATGRSNMAVGDVDNDGKLDVLIGFSQSTLGGGNLLFCRNVGSNREPRFEIGPFQTGQGRFVEWTGSEGHDQGHNGAPCLYDWDGDGRVDLFHGVETGRIAFYDNGYLNLKAFPLFQWTEFAELVEGGAMIRMDAARLPESLPLSPVVAQVPLQWLPDEAFLKSGKGQTERFVRIVSPLPGADVREPVPLEAEATGVGLVAVDFYLDGRHIYTERRPPYVAFGDDAKWDPSTVEPGEHELAVRVTYLSGPPAVAKQAFRVSKP